MAKANITQYSATPSSNADINDINISENCPASGLNNAIRELMAHLKNVDTGSQALTALSVTGAVTSGTIKISDGGTIGSASDTDAMAISSNGVVTFSQTTVGAGGMDLLLSSTISSAVAQFDISSTHFTSTHDDYYLHYTLDPVTDNVSLTARVFVSGSAVTGSVYQYEHILHGGSGGKTSNGDTVFHLTHDGMGNVAGEGASGQIIIKNVNNTAFPLTISGTINKSNTSGNHNATTFGGSLDVSEKGSVVNGFRLFMSSGNLATGNIKLYGLRS
tara:strand:+ start:387 stop:1211 length:825 start_codon:yes stop_codon:yes gene_type:complete